MREGYIAAALLGVAACMGGCGEAAAADGGDAGFAVPSSLRPSERRTIPAWSAPPPFDGGASNRAGPDAAGWVNRGEAADGGPRSDGGLRPTEPLHPVEPAWPGVTVSLHGDDGFAGHEYRWQDASEQSRSGFLVHNLALDPMGRWGGYLRRYAYQASGETRVCEGIHSRHPGFGFMTNHHDGTATLSLQYPGLWSRPLFTGRHHALHEYAWEYDIGAARARITAHWLFATGRDHPVLAITYDLSASQADAVLADTRSPYGLLSWDGGLGVDVDGVGWGDRYRFRSLGAPITLLSGWDYSIPNRVPHVLAWSDAVDAEMGLVQTESYLRHDAGGYWFYRAWGSGDPDGPMPDPWNWTYQLNQYDLAAGSHSKRIAWGSNYGAVGGAAYPAYGGDVLRSGWPYQSYSVHVVLGTRGSVEAQVAEVEAIGEARLTATVGRVREAGPPGIARSDAIARDPPGYDPRYGTWEVEAEGGRVEVTLTPALQSPILVVHQWPGGPPRVWIGGAPATADVDFFASTDPVAGTLWLTLAGTPPGPLPILVE